ncbi:MAG TPA: menaquinone biosynthesis decarboxylase, partial [Chitinophaga sp.]
KDYAGQAQKTMNAMWGAGQMMFNKILAVTDEQCGLRDYKQLAQYMFRHLDPSRDIYFSQGPMDVLDHSCSKMGFGGKMCIDGTRKFEEETAGETYVVHDGTLDASALRAAFPEIKGVNASLLAQDISCLLLAVEKNRPGHIAALNEALYQLPALQGIKMILYVEHTVQVSDLASSLWRFCNNLDPKRDNFVVRYHTAEGKTVSGIGLDGTLKTKAFDNFQRDWPNIIVADDQTIASVDAKWPQLGLGPFVASPSHKYKDQLYGEEAVVNVK